VGNGASNFLNRSVFYTAISRTKRELQMFGSSDHFSSIARRSANPRFSALANKVQERE
jgi:ATP-dependent exoDNAse (exonuclease V) alpha subunit